MRGKNVLMIWDRMGDYHRARWNATRRLLSDRLVFAADLGSGDDLYSWNDTSEDMHTKLSQKNPAKFDIARLRKFVRLVRSKSVGYVCIAGYGKPEYILFLVYCRLTNRKVLLFAESWYPSSALFDKIKGWFLRFFCDAFLVSGKRAEEHFINRLGISKIKVGTGYSVVDNDHFSFSQPVERRKQVLYMGRFAPEKNTETLVRAFCDSDLPNSGWELVMIGGGPLHRQLVSIASGQPIRLLGWQSYNDLPKLYGGATIFILPSSFEPWGLVVNEAMAAGLPIILSNEVGCLPDLLQDEVNGWCFPSSQVETLKIIFNRAGNMALTDLNEMGRASKKIVSAYSLDLFAANVKALLLHDHVRRP